MRILAYESTTGGGVAGLPIPEELAREGAAMLASLLSDLSDLEGVDALTTRDNRLGPPTWSNETVFPLPGEDPLAHFARAAHEADAVWPIAPETDGVLETLTNLIIAHDKILLGSRPDAVRITSSKWHTAECLREAGIPVVPTYREAAQISDLPGNWVIKPDDGAGCGDTFRLNDAGAARAWLDGDIQRRFVAQPWIEGDPLSLSLVCRDGHANVLSCNRQHVRENCGQLILQDVAVGIRPIGADLYELARRITRAVPGLWGYVGIDLVYSASGPVVMEINPRLTGSYCGLRSKLGVNVAAVVLRLLDGTTRCCASSNPEFACTAMPAQSPGDTHHVV